MMADVDEREEELETLSAIYPELLIDPNDPLSISLELPVAPTKPLLARFLPITSSESTTKDTYAQAATNGAAHIEHDIELSHLPPLNLQVMLANGYPEHSPPKVHLTSKYDWLPAAKLAELEADVSVLWEEYGRCQIVFAYIDHLQQSIERAFDLDQSAKGCLVLPVTAENDLVTFDSETKQAIFNAGTYDCGICLEPKKGSSCYQLQKCGHVFCQQCLQDFYNNAISEGDVASIKCLDPDCGKTETPSTKKRKRTSERTLHPRELLAMGVEEIVVRRYVEMKRKKRLEADKSTVYCPRSWCQGPARSSKYPPVPADVATYAESESSEDDGDADSPDDLSSDHKPNNVNNLPPNPVDRLAICEKCALAFCKVCYMGWHGPFASCFPRNPAELSAEEKASYDYIRLHTSPCPYCSSPTQKTMGCNHMNCFQCHTHFCYLCGSWLDSRSPYNHFNKPGTQCYQRLWELEEGDEGQGPGDGRGFAGGRGWEQIAIEVAREAEAQEAAAAAAAAQAEENDRQAAVNAPLEVRIADLQLDDAALPAPNRGARRQRNPFPAHHPVPGAANAVRNHERNRGRANGPVPRARRQPALNEEERQQQELQRFLEMALRDEEEGWNSDELGDDDEGFVIR